MPKIPESPRAIVAGTVGAMLADACRQCAAEKDGLLDWRVTGENVVIILPDGRKVSFDVVPAAAARAAEPVTNGDGKAPAGDLPAAVPVTNGSQVVTPGVPGAAGDDTKEIPIAEAMEIIHKIARREKK